LFLGIDIGTYSSMGMLVAPAGRVVKTVVVELFRQLLTGSPYRGADVAFSDHNFDQPAGFKMRVSVQLPSRLTLEQVWGAPTLRSLYNTYA
jgi:hypothetical protein